MHKSFSKDFVAHTDINTNGYPTYRRRNTGATVTLKRGDKEYQVDNRWTVPYNKYLLLKYDCHINLEFCASITSVKYIFKYVYQGHDCADIQTTTGEYQQENNDNVIKWDEISKFQDTRYVSGPEAAWRINKFPMQYRSHPIIRLAVHLPLDQSVFFQPGHEAQAVANAASKDTTLTAWFKLCATDERARQYTYRDIPQHYCFNKQTTRWKPRKKIARVIGRIFSVSVKEIERYCLRLLLIDVKGAISYEDLRTVEDTIYPTFKEAAKARNLLHDDTCWDKAMEEAATFQMPVQLRQLFVDICSDTKLTVGKQLFDKYWFHLSENYIRNGHDEEISKNLALKWIQDELRKRGVNMEEAHDLPAPNFALINQLVEPNRIQVNDNLRREECCEVT